MMYTGSYTGDGEVRIPEGYNGTMLNEEAAPVMCEEAPREARNPQSILAGLFRKDSFLNIPILKELHIGIEEILILATALFLFSSRNGDKECALMLLLLLFVK